MGNIQRIFLADKRVGGEVVVDKLVGELHVTASVGLSDKQALANESFQLILRAQGRRQPRDPELLLQGPFALLAERGRLAQDLTLDEGEKRDAQHAQDAQRAEDDESATSETRISNTSGPI